MQTFLPSGYRFSLNRLINFGDYHGSVITHIIVNSIGTTILGLLAGIIAFGLLHSVFNDCKHDTRHKGTLLNLVKGILMIFMMIFFFSVVPIRQDDWHTEDFIKQDFHYPVTDSNLVIKCISIVDDNGDPNMPQSIHDEKKYPYRLFIIKDNSEKCYLGTMKNGHFEPGTTYLAGLFYQYMQYVQSHHLENKFKQSFCFEKSGKYLNKNKVQWILTNNHDIDLHLVDNSTIKESKIVAN